jgi:hypothetical protein
VLVEVALDALSDGLLAGVPVELAGALLVLELLERLVRRELVYVSVVAALNGPPEPSDQEQRDQHSNEDVHYRHTW